MGIFKKMIIFPFSVFFFTCSYSNYSKITRPSERPWAVYTHGMFGEPSFGDGSKPWYLVNPKIAGKWMFIPLKCIYRY